MPATHPPLSHNAYAVLRTRYLMRDTQGRILEGPTKMFRRVARNIASVEQSYGPSNIKYWEDEFFELMASLDFLPNSPALMNAGRRLQQLSACFVIPIADNMEAIFDAVKLAALVHQSGGGTGFSFGKLRPEGDIVSSTGGLASGPISFMRAFDTATDIIRQGGMRRGANMAVLRVDHPDIMKFIRAKAEPSAFTNFNTSVAATSEFMEKAKRGESYELVNPRTGQVVGELNAEQVFDEIIDLAWKTGDPGILFIDRINKDNPTPKLGEIESTNPCGEQPLLPWECCTLGSINLVQHVHRQGKGWAVNWPRLERTIMRAVRFLDNVIDVNKYADERIEKATEMTRKIGLGVMGFADMLIRLGIPYDSEEALNTAEEVMSFINDKATAASIELAKERGTFPAFQDSTYDVNNGPKVRNATRITIAPTGTLSIIADCSSSIEPLFALSYFRTALSGVQLRVDHRLFVDLAKQEGFYSKKLIDFIRKHGSVRGIDMAPQWVQRLFPTALDIVPEWHVRMQAAFQNHADNGVSKTVNLPHYSSRRDVARVFTLAYDLGCKGVTVYRYGSKEEQPLTLRCNGMKACPYD